jgi:rod shape-determining protein MreD
MSDSLWPKLDSAARSALPFVSAFVCVLLGVMTWPLPSFGMIAPPLALIAVYYWSIHRPDLFGPGLAFVIGLLHDVVHYLPIGLSALLFVAAHQIIFHQRRFFTGHSFFVMWWGFALTCVMVQMAGWLLHSLVNWQILPPLPIIAQTGLAVAAFPLLCWIFIHIQRATTYDN